MGNNKSPGSDGLSKEFYVCFFYEIHSYLLRSPNMSFREGQLSSSQRQAVIVLIEKRTRTKDFSKTGGQFPLLMNQEGNWKISSL